MCDHSDAVSRADPPTGWAALRIRMPSQAATACSVSINRSAWLREASARAFRGLAQGQKSRASANELLRHREQAPVFASGRNAVPRRGARAPQIHESRW